MEKLLLAFNTIEENSALAYFDGEKPDSLVCLAETALGISFPNTYRKFLKKYGCGSIMGEEFYGVIRDDFVNSGVPDAVWLTLDERETCDLPAYMVIVYSVGDRSYIVLNCSKKSPEGECPLELWWPGASKSTDNLEFIAHDFGEFMLEKLRNHLKN